MLKKKRMKEKNEIQWNKKRKKKQRSDKLAIKEEKTE